jgi:small multidrug resistance family-3 protein
MLNTLGLFVITAIAEIVGCYLPYLWLKQGKSIWLLLPAALSLALFAWLLSLHPTAAGRVYAAYGGVWRRVCRRGTGLAVAGRWRAPDLVGPAWLRRGDAGHGDHHVCATNFLIHLSKASHP